MAYMGTEDDLVGAWGDVWRGPAARDDGSSVRLHTTRHGKFHSLIGGVQAFGGNCELVIL